MQPEEIVAGGTYTGEGGPRSVVEITDAHPRAAALRSTGRVVGYRRTGDGPVERMGLKAFARWAERRVGAPPVPTASAPAPAPDRRRRGLAEDVKAAITELRALGMPEPQLLSFAVGMFSARYGLAAAVARAPRLKRMLASEGGVSEQP